MGKDEKIISDVLLRIPFMRFGLVTVSLPAFALAYCFLSAYLLDREGINDTDCNVTNSIPSASAVTGIKPQAYVWRACVGLHSAPRFIVGIMYYNWYKQFAYNIGEKYRWLYYKLLQLVFWLYTIECSCLVAVSCISNKENYPVHEKIFIVFMVASIAHMVFATTAFKWSKHKGMTEIEKKSYFWKKFMLLWISLSTVALLYYFYQHRVLCKPGAFSKFSVFEYMIAYANIGFHLTGLYEFKDKTLLGADLHPTDSNGVRNGKISRFTSLKNGGRRKAE